MTLTLKKFKCLQGASEETLCYSAELCADGKMVAHCSNSGHGGGDMIRFKDRAVEADIMERVAKMPDHVCDFNGKDGKPLTYKQDLDSLTQGLACDMDRQDGLVKDSKRMAKKFLKTLYVRWAKREYKPDTWTTYQFTEKYCTPLLMIPALEVRAKDNDTVAECLNLTHKIHVKQPVQVEIP